MPKLRNIRQGQKAKQRGDFFERWLHREARVEGWKVIQIPLGCKQIRGNQLIRVATPFDFVFAKNGWSIFADAKICSAGNFGYTRIERHQATELMDLQRQGHPAGYIICFAENENWNSADTYFFSAAQLVALQPRDSLKKEAGLLVGKAGRIFLSNIITAFDTDQRQAATPSYPKSKMDC